VVGAEDQGATWSALLLEDSGRTLHRLDLEALRFRRLCDERGGCHQVIGHRAHVVWEDGHEGLIFED